ncbi:MAG: hypothetical protein GX817_03685 [Elusimicrobia bacterium]|nr:hypothetical protein [Elusimicrobiota bacterium]
MFFLSILPLGAEVLEDDSIDLLKGLLDKYSLLDRYMARIEVDMTMYSYEDIPNSISYASDIFYEKNQGFAVINRYGLLGKSIISNTEKMWVHVPALNKYAVMDSPSPTYDYLAADSSSIDTLGTERFLLFSLITEKISISSSTFSLSAGELDGIQQLIFEFCDEGVEYSVWVDTYTGVINRLDLKASHYFDAGPDELVKVSLEYTELHKNPEFDSLIDREIFVFNPGPDDEESELIFAGDSNSETLYAGEVLPDFSFIPHGEEDSVEIYDILNQEGRPLILYFWEPGSEDSERLGQVLEDLTADFNLTLLAVNSTEDRTSFREYSGKDEGKIIYAFDEENTISDIFRIESYPTLILISDNRIKQIYTDYFSSLENIIREDLNLLSADGPPSHRRRGMEATWRLELKATSLLGGEFLKVATLTDEIFHIDSSGRIRDRNSVPPEIREIVRYGEKGAFAGYSLRGRKVFLMGADGRELSSFETPSGINQISSFGEYKLAGLQTDSSLFIYKEGEEPVLIPHTNGVLSISVGDLDASGEIKLATVDGSSSFKILSEAGEVQTSVSSLAKLDFISIAGRGSLLVSGSAAGNQLIALVDTAGIPLWEMMLGTEGSSKITSVSYHPLNDWVAVGTLDGQVFVFDMSGRVIGYEREEGVKVEVEWFEKTPGQYGLAVSTPDGGLALYSLAE